MRTLIIILTAIIFLFAFALVLAVYIAKSRKNEVESLEKKNKELEEVMSESKKTIGIKNDYIRKYEEKLRESSQGSGVDNFNASVELVSDIAKDGAKRNSRK